MYRLKSGGKGKVRVQLLGSGTILREVLAAAELLEERFDIPADVWSVTSFSELRRDALDVERWNARHPEDERADELRRSVLGGCRRPVRRRDGLHEDRVGSDSPVGAGALRRARHGRVRAQRRPRGAAPPLRSRPQVGRRRGAQSARRRGQHRLAARSAKR